VTLNVNTSVSLTLPFDEFINSINHGFYFRFNKVVVKKYFIFGALLLDVFKGEIQLAHTVPKFVDSLQIFGVEAVKGGLGGQSPLFNQRNHVQLAGNCVLVVLGLAGAGLRDRFLYGEKGGGERADYRGNVGSKGGLCGRWIVPYGSSL